MECTIRDYEKKDKFPLFNLSNDDWQYAIFNIFTRLNDNNQIEKCLIAEVDGNIVGFVYGFVLPNKTLIPEFLYVKQSFRNKGIGFKLIKQLEIRSKCEVSMVFYNNSLHDFYIKQGYQVGDNLEVAIKPLEAV